jgi:hypothetical protein
LKDHGISTVADWALLGQAFECMPQLRELELAGFMFLLILISVCLIELTGLETYEVDDDECFISLVDGLSTLKLLEKLILPGYCCSGNITYLLN